MTRTWILFAAATLVACQVEQDAPASPVPRPVLTRIVATQADDASEFTGRIESRETTQLGFRVGGRIVRRSVWVGDRLKRGAEIAAIDPGVLQLAVESARANLAAVQARFANAGTSQLRQARLLQDKVVPTATLEDSQAALDVAAAAVEEARARLAKAEADASYAVLRADFSGVVTRLEAEVGQIVTPHSVVAELARTDALDCVLDVPDSVARSIAIGAPFDIAEVDASGALPGKLRRIGPTADRATRTRRLWVALDAPPADLRLGTMVRASLANAVHTRIVVPAQALFEQDGQTLLWIVDADHVSSRVVVLGERSDDEATVDSGLQPGERIVVAGVHSLSHGQKITLAEETPP